MAARSGIFVFLLLSGCSGPPTRPASPAERLAGTYRRRSAGASDSLQISAAGKSIRFKLLMQGLTHGRHSCSLAGVARAERGGYVYVERAPGPVFGKVCRLVLLPSATSIELRDDGTCVEHCGAGHSFDAVRFPR